MRLSIGRRIGGVWFGVSFRPGGSKRRRKAAARYWTHGTCTIRHRTPEAAQRCRGAV